MKKLFEFLGAAYALMVFISAGIMAYADWGAVDGFAAHWDLIIRCLWQGGLWPLFLPAYF